MADSPVDVRVAQVLPLLVAPNAATIFLRAIAPGTECFDMRLMEQARAYHRFWRYRLRTERDELQFLLSQDFAGSTIVDAGANRGAYSYWMHRAVGPAGRVVAFEPQAKLADYLADLKRAFRLSRLEIVRTALSDQPGELTLVRPRNHWGGAGFHFDPQLTECDLLRVPVSTLDEYFARHDWPPVRFIKCDVQDHETQVLRGAARLLATQRPTVLVEQADWCYYIGEVSAQLTSLGYSCYFFFQRRLVSIDELPRYRSQIPAQFINYLYRPRDASRPRAAA